MKTKTLFTIFLLAITLFACAPAATAIPTEAVAPMSTLTLTPPPTPTFTPSPTATPYGGGKDNPRVAVFTELEPDDTAAGYIRIGNIDFNKPQIVFSDIKIRVGTKPGSLSSTGYGERMPPDILWSPNGNYLAFTWVEDGKAKVFVYDFAAQKLKWELELPGDYPGNFWENGMAWSADSNWLYIQINQYADYILNIANGEINKLSNKKIQSLAWHATQPLLFFENPGGTSFYQYDPVKNESTQIDSMKFDLAYTEGRYDHYNNGYLFPGENKDNSKSIYLETSDKPIFELVHINSDVPYLSIYKIIPSPGRSSYLIGGQVNLPFNDTYSGIYTSFAVNAKYPLTITEIKSQNGIYPFSWSPDGKSFIGYQYLYETGSGINVKKMVIVDAETNSIVNEYEMGVNQTLSIYGYLFRTGLSDYTGPQGVDVYWP